VSLGQAGDKPTERG